MLERGRQGDAHQGGTSKKDFIAKYFYPFAEGDFLQVLTTRKGTGIHNLDAVGKGDGLEVLKIAKGTFANFNDTLFHYDILVFFAVLEVASIDAFYFFLFGKTLGFGKVKIHRFLQNLQSIVCKTRN